MMKKLIAVASLISIATSVYAYEYDNGYSDDQNSGYESSSGNQYQYDLSDPSDSIDYGVDLDAQMRDSISVEPSRSLDRGIGEHGGGIYE